MMRHEAWRRADTPARIDFQLYPGESANMAFVCKDSAPNGSRLDPAATGATVVIDGKEHPAAMSTEAETIVDVVIPSAAITGPTTYTLLLTDGDRSTAFASGIITRSALVT